MAVTIHDTPEAYTPSDNPVTWTFSSNQTAQPNFYYEITVYINDVAVHEAQVFPESGIYSKYDASEWTSINTNRPVTTTNLTDDAENSCLVKIKVTERYGDPVADGASSTASNVVAWKACMTNEDFDAWSAAAYVNDGVTTGIKWLTNFPDSSIQKVGLTEHVSE